MKKLSFLLLSVLLFTMSTARADEGMWLLPLLQKYNITKMSQMGLKLSAKDIYDINNSSLKDAVVHFGRGCTGEIISGEGLLLTNHHCGYGTIQKLSSVENDYLQNGFWAMSREQEIPSPGLTVTFLESFSDVTEDINNAIKGITEDIEVKKEIEKISKEIATKAVNGNKYLSAKVVPMYGGNAYYLIVSKIFTDIRFVGAPPSSVGKFGADTDNWMWPRHTGDFSMFRVYAGKDNNPADYSKDNVPYKPKKFFTISLKGVQENDFAMIIGYPGRTSRFMTSYEVNETKDITNAITIYARGLRQEALMEEMLADPKVRLQYSSKYAGSSNYWKKAIGMNETFAKLKVAERRAEQEKAFEKWMEQDPSRRELYGESLSQIKSAVEGRREDMIHYKYLTETLMNIEIASVATHYQKVAELLKAGKKDEAAKGIKFLEGRVKNFFINYSANTDRKVAKVLMKAYRNKMESSKLPEIYKKIDSEFGGDIDKYVDYIFDNTVFSSYDKIMKAIEESPESMLEDPAMVAGLSISSAIPALYSSLNKWGEVYAQGQKSYIAALMEMRKGNPLYPDANSTMRLTYGKVLSYSPKDAVHYNFYTTLTGVMEKEDPANWEFVVPQKLKDLYNSGDFGQYAMADGKMPVAFITNNDITGGNSGSPVINAKGELIGTAFDGNWEAMSGDIIFEPNLQRCINVDIRYTLFIMDKFGGAGYLLNEMKIVK